MQKTFMAALLLLVLVLSAALVRVQIRNQGLAERLADAERLRPPRPAPPPPPAPAPAVPPAAPPASLQVQDLPSLEEKIQSPPVARTSPRIPKVLSSGPSATDHPFLPQTTEDLLPAGRRPGYLGIIGLDEEGGGVRITQVQPGTVAAWSGLQPGDVLLEVNGERVANYGDLAAKVRLYGEGGPVTLRIRRGVSDFYQGAQLGPRPP
jgi:membrane-associated protease RseP (regulator of RpoE activity)